MKKIFAMGIALLSVFCFTSCGNEDGPSDNVKGTYVVERTIEMRLPPSIPFMPVTHQTKLTMESVNEDFVNISLPGAIYTMNGEEMDLPSFTLLNVPVMDDGNGGVKIPHHEFSQKVEKKDVIGVIEGEVDSDRELELVVEFKYGSMPFYMIHTYKSL